MKFNGTMLGGAMRRYYLPAYAHYYLKVLVVTNPGSARTIELRLANMAASVPLKANSVATMAWR